jgi:hypothetical protein
VYSRADLEVHANPPVQLQLRFVKPEMEPRKLRPDRGSSLHFCPGSLLPFTTAISLWHLAFVIFIPGFCVDDLQCSGALGSRCSLVRQLRALMDVRREETTPRQMYAYLNFQDTVSAHGSTYDGSNNGRVLVESAILRLLYTTTSRMRPLVRILNFPSRTRCHASGSQRLAVLVKSALR